MSASIASTNAWAGPVGSSGGWRMVRPQGRQALQWVMQRNCSMSPRDLGLVYLLLCAVSLSIALGFWWHGATIVLAFAGLELLLVGLAFLAYARHATDGEILTLDGQWLEVAQSHGSRVRQQRFRSEWVRVEPLHGEGSLLEISGQGAAVQVGRYLRPQWRVALARDLRRALRQQPVPAANEESLEQNLT
jgi:uncharacterized membrane protein